VRKILVIATLLVCVLCSLPPGSSSVGQEKTGAAMTAVPDGAFKVTIATGGGLYGPAKSRFKVGEDVPVVISMTNTGDKPAQYCLSTSIFQNRPQLRKDGQLLPYLSSLSQQADKEDAIEQCERSQSKQLYDLQPNETKVVDWFKISSMGIAWYELLSAGHYELVLMRRVECCQGTLLETNKIAFEVVP
jgi:hypothetical protein